MKRLMVGVGVLAVVVANQAFAADMPVLKAPAAPAPAPSSWNGWYVGGEVGGVTVNNTWNTTCVQGGFANQPTASGGSNCAQGTANTAAGGFPGAPDSTANQTMKNSSLRPGIYMGGMFQAGSTNLVFGIEADYAFSSKTASVAGIPGCSTAACTGGVNVPFSLSGDSVTIQNRNDGSLRARGGYLVTPDVLLYATGGLAWTSVTTTATCNGNTLSPACNNGGFSTAVLTGGNSGTIAGYTVGGGVEWKIYQNWLLRGEYRYNHYTDLRSNYFVGSGVLEVYAKTNANTQIATAGLAYLFPIAK